MAIYLLTLCRISIFTNSTFARSSWMDRIERLGNTYFRLLSSLNRRKSWFLQKWQRPSQPSRLRSSKVIVFVMETCDCVGAKRWKCNAQVSIVERIKAQICRLSLWYIVRCKKRSSDFILAPCGLKRNFFVRCYV